MTETEVRNILFKELEIQDTEKAIIETYYKIYSAIVTPKARHLVNSEEYELLIETMRAKSMLCLRLDANSINFLPKEMLENIISAYECWLRIFKYAHDHYEQFKSKLKENETKESLAQSMTIVDRRLAEHKKVFALTQTLAVLEKDFTIMRMTFDWFLARLIGADIYALCAGEFNKSLIFLRRYQAALSNEEGAKYKQ